MLVPIAVSFLAGLLITLALEVEMPSSKPHPSPSAPAGAGRRGAGRPSRRRPWWRPPSSTLSPSACRSPSRSRRRAARAGDGRGRGSPPRRASPIGAVLDFLHEAVEIVDDATKIEMSDAYIGYAAWCKTKSLRALEPGEFCNEMTDLCAQFGIPIQEEAGCVYLGNVRLAA